MLELNDVVKRFPVGDAEPVRAVDHVSLSVADGELVALYGPSGSGKSTLLKLAAAVIHPDSGEVLLDGERVSGLSATAAAHYRMNDIGLVRQSLDLIPGASALDNAAIKLLGRRASVREAQRKVLPLLEHLGLGERLKHPAEDLSMGERQRVMIARALSTEPRLVLADEPTGSLDSERGAEVLGMLRGMCKEREIGVLLVTHDPQAAEFADRVQALRDGRLQGDASQTSEGR